MKASPALFQLLLAWQACRAEQESCSAELRDAGPVQMLSLSQRFSTLFPSPHQAEIILAQDYNTELPISWLEGPAWLPNHKDGSASILVSDVIENRVWRLTALDDLKPNAEIFLEPSGKAQTKDGARTSLSHLTLYISQG